MKVNSIVLTLLFLSSCAGPTTPFGSNVFISNDYEVPKSSNMGQSEMIKMESFPEKKIYHSNFNLKIKIKNPYGFKPNFRYQIVYNGHLLNRWWKSETIELNKNKTEAIISFQNLSLLPGLRNNIQFLYYESENSDPIVYAFSGPECSITNYQMIGETHPFELKSSFLETIEAKSKENHINPSLLAALVAQESSFNAKAVSTSRAVGLTQVTPLADSDIRMQKKEWESYPNSSKLSYINLKYKIYTGVINDKNDWRLDKNKSVEGGAIYLNQLQEFWNSEHNLNFLHNHFESIPMTEIILASYNSGPTRVKRNIKKLKKDWIWSQELNEARKYVMNIKSYCYQFKK